MLITLALSIALAAAPTPVAATSTGPARPAAVVEAVDVTASAPDKTAARPHETTVVFRGQPGEALVCKREIPVGSRLKVRTCRTAYDWAEKSAASLRNLDQMIGKGTYP